VDENLPLLLVALSATQLVAQLRVALYYAQRVETDVRRLSGQTPGDELAAALDAVAGLVDRVMECYAHAGGDLQTLRDDVRAASPAVTPHDGGVRVIRRPV
jgi:hypothetical protein